jgi:Hg(II)-responsive transcriptional regulator
MFTISQAAEQAGVNIETLRYYERKGILPRPDRSESNYRLYTQDTVARVRFIKRAQGLGFSLKEVEELLALRATHDARSDEVRSRAEMKMREVDVKIRALELLRAVLGGLVKECTSQRGAISECPILDALDTDTEREIAECGCQTIKA